jgi:DNA helicase HerA-like ATPase
MVFFSNLLDNIVSLLNFQVRRDGPPYTPSLILVIGENENSLASFARQLIDRTFRDRRARSIIFPTVSFIFDEADVFIQRRERGEDDFSPSVIEQATLLARRGRKFGLGLGIATQRIRYLDSSIRAQPHTYFISKLPRASDRQAIAEAFAISDESLEQTFAFTTGQWLIASHDATGLKSTPFPVQLPNANDAVRQWLAENQLL